MTKAEQALTYAQERDWAVFPLKPDTKVPLTPHGFKDASRDPDQINRWWRENPDANIGVATGVAYRLAVLDIDVKNGAKGLESLKTIKPHLVPTLTVFTPSGGAHYYYSITAPLQGRIGFLPGLDLKADGGYIVAPGSAINGKPYEWSKSERAIATLPPAFIEFFTKRARTAKPQPSGEIVEGERNDAMFRLACSLRASGLDENSIAAALQEHNLAHCHPPLSRDEVRQIAGSASTYEAKKSGKEPNAAAKLIEIVMEECTLFHDEHHTPFAQFPVEDHSEHWPCRSSQFKGWLSRRLWQIEKYAVSTETINAALNVICAEARYEGQEIALHVRVALHDGAIYYDLSDDRWRAVRIDEAGWRLVQNPPLIFRRYGHQRPQALPVTGGKVEDVFQFVNIEDKAQRLVFMAMLVSFLVPEIPHPIPIPHGEQGSAKSTLFRVLRLLIDPSSTEILTFPSDRQELAQQLMHHWVLPYDNVSALSREQSDTLCRAVTGGGFTKRALFTDDDDIIYTGRRCIGLNGINVAATQPDLLDRSILFGLESIDPKKRRLEKVFWADFESARPAIFGAMLDILSHAMKLHSIFKVGLFRMADFTQWGCAVTKALGYDSGDFMTAYHQNIQAHNEEAVNNNPVAAVLVRFMDKRTAWEGSASKLLEELTVVAEELKINPKVREWPKAPNSLVRRLNEVIPNLRQLGIKFVQTTSDKKRGLAIVKETTPSLSPVSLAPSPAPAVAATAHDDADDTDDISGALDRTEERPLLTPKNQGDTASPENIVGIVDSQHTPTASTNSSPGASHTTRFWQQLSGLQDRLKSQWPDFLYHRPVKLKQIASDLDSQIKDAVLRLLEFDTFRDCPCNPCDRDVRFKTLLADYERCCARGIALLKERGITPPSLEKVLVTPNGQSSQGERRRAPLWPQ